MSRELEIEYDYTSVPTVRAFVHSDKFIKAIMGPYGSGKSSACVMDLLQRSFAQEPDATNTRRTRFAIVRNTYQQLKDTTKKTIDEWIPFAEWKESNHTFTIDIERPDGTFVHSEWLLRALDRPDQVSNLLSLELTGAWLNEAKELPKEVFDNIQSRVGRYPRRKKDSGPTWSGLILDTNPPDFDHWWYRHFEENKPENSEIFKQPSGIGPDAENIDHLREGYYTNMAIGKDPDFIKVFIEGNYGYLKDGKPVWNTYKDSVHAWKDEDHGPMALVRGLPVVIGLDCGLTPAAIFTQCDIKGRLFIHKEICGDYMDMRDFTEQFLKPIIRTWLHGIDYIIIGDPAGSAKSQVDSRSVYKELKSQGLKARPSGTNSLQPRLGAVSSFLNRMIEGKPGFYLNPSCVTLRRAMNGGYKFRRIRVGGERYTDLPDKNQYSHIADALQYACVFHDRGFSEYIEENFSTRPGLVAAEPVHHEAWT